MFKAIGVIASAVLAFLTFRLFFFVAAPYVAGMIPFGPWKQLLDLAVYIAIAYFGGIALPAIILVVGVAISFRLG